MTTNEQEHDRIIGREPDQRQVFHGPPADCRFQVMAPNTTHHCVSKSQVKRICYQLGYDPSEAIERHNPLTPLCRNESNHMDHPIQPIDVDRNDIVRFKENKIVSFLLETCGKHGVDLNTIAGMDFPQNDREQFAQLIGYSLDGFADLSYVRDATYETAEKMHKQGLTEDQARIQHLEEVIAGVREAVRELVPLVFRINPDDLEE